VNAGPLSLQPYREGFAALPRAPQSWLQTLREDAMRRALATGFPSPRDESWKYTSATALEKRAFAPAGAAAHIDPSAIAATAIQGLDTDRAVFVDGRFQASLSRLPSAVRASALAADDARELLAVPVEWEQDTFLSLNTALFQEGLLLELDAVCDRPLELTHLSLPQGKPASQHPRCVLRLGPGAKLLLIERYVGLDDAEVFTNSCLQIELQQSSSLEHVRLQTDTAKGFHVGRLLVRQAADSNYVSHNLQLGAHWSRLDLHTKLEAPGAQAVLNGFYAVNGRQHADTHTRIDHLAPGATSDELYRGILDGHGRAVFNGKVLVAKHAVKTDAQQANHNLILSRGAEIDTKPELEIYADDVKCSHGASIGQLDEQQLFYLRSRGLDTATARELLIAAFAEAVFTRLPHAALQIHARRLLAGILPQINTPELP
jgi:Fe-S cluster assembly protein SufD